MEDVKGVEYFCFQLYDPRVKGLRARGYSDATSRSNLKKKMIKRRSSHLEVSINNVVLMEVAKGRDDLCSIEAGTVLRKNSHF